MTVSIQTRQALVKRSKECIRLAGKRFERDFSLPKIRIVPDSREVGRACWEEWTVQLNEALLVSQPKDMIRDALPHEIAHLIDMKMNLYTYATMKRVPHHGYGWKTVMRLFNATPSAYF